ncbi:MAG: hypothetical protein DMG11_08055 [Acidobacteria bacterium]|nr:MAG: hypothetical protein DMG11_08055 [Acidobacteriota bacterium]
MCSWANRPPPGATALSSAAFAKPNSERKLLETFDWKFNPHIDRLQIEELASGDFIRRQSSLILVGQAASVKVISFKLSACAPVRPAIVSCIGPLLSCSTI